MARNHPRFLYDNVTGTKSDGEYIMHLLEPRVLLKIDRTPRGQFYIYALDEIENSKKLQTTIAAAEKWYRAVVSTRSK